MRHLRLVFLLLAGLMVVGLVAGTPVLRAAPAATYTLTEKDSGTTVTLQAGDRLRLNLRNPGDGGYRVLEPLFDHRVLTLLSRRDLPPKKRPQPLMGDFGRIEFTWKARRPGTTKVTVNIARPWEKQQPPEHFVTIQVVVR